MQKVRKNNLLLLLLLNFSILFFSLEKVFAQAPEMNAPPAMPMPPTNQLPTPPPHAPPATAMPAPPAEMIPPAPAAAPVDNSHALPTNSPTPDVNEYLPPQMQGAAPSAPAAIALTRKYFFMDTKSDVVAFPTNEECKKMAKSISTCEKANCRIVRVINTALIESVYEIQGWEKNKCRYSYSHHAPGTANVAMIKCELNKNHLTQLSRLFKSSLAGEAFTAESSECVSTDAAGKPALNGECSFTIKDKKTLDVEKLANYWGQCK